jgi:hypothetical protein
MSENKKVIRVKDLVIEADNVIIETKRRPDPFFGGFRRGGEEERLESSSSRESVSGERDEGDEQDRRPFSWI